MCGCVGVVVLKVIAEVLLKDFLRTAQPDDRTIQVPKKTNSKAALKRTRRSLRDIEGLRPVLEMSFHHSMDRTQYVILRTIMRRKASVTSVVRLGLRKIFSSIQRATITQRATRVVYIVGNGRVPHTRCSPLGFLRTTLALKLYGAERSAQLRTSM